MSAGNGYYAKRMEGQHRTGNARAVYMHRVILGLQDRSLMVDHINRDGLDNRRENIRIATAQQNCMNRRYERKSASGFRGVTWNKNCQRWQAAIKSNGKQRHLGLFSDAIEAAHVYDDHARNLFGEFARLNFPQSGEQAA
jgi:hypothetical protein